MAFRRRQAAVPSITERLEETFKQRVRMGPFLSDEVDLVQVSSRTGLVRVPRPTEAAATDGESVEAIRRRLEEGAYLRSAPPRPADAPRDQVPATVGPDQEPVTLLGDFAIVCALRGRPATLTEARWHGPDGDDDCRMYSGVAPDVMLQELTLDGGRLGFFLYRADRGILGLAGICGVEADDLHRQAPPPSRTQLPVGEARARWTQWTDLRVARPEGQNVILTTLLVGRDPDGLWVAEPPYDTAMAEWTDPNAFGERLTELVTPAPGTESWLPEDPAE